MSAVTTAIGLGAVIDAALRNGTGENPVWDGECGEWTWIDWTLPEVIGSLIAAQAARLRHQRRRP